MVDIKVKEWIIILCFMSVKEIESFLIDDGSNKVFSEFCGGSGQSIHSQTPLCVGVVGTT